jgi:hypothetical protein
MHRNQLGKASRDALGHQDVNFILGIVDDGHKFGI